MTKCLIIIDYQNDFIVGSLGFKRAKRLAPKIIERIDYYHNSDNVCIFIVDEHNRDYHTSHESRWIKQPHCLEGTDGCKIYDDVYKHINTNDIIISKNTLGSDKLFNHLQNNLYASIEIVGLMTEACVLSNAIVARTAQPQTPIFVNKQLVSSRNWFTHQKALSLMASLHIKVF